jgi:prepilin signal peptidase PulO-like enzyme (type II secretory pathway)
MTNFIIEKPSNKKFGLFFSFAIFLINAYYFIFKDKVILSLLILLIVFIFLSVLKPDLLRLPNKLWMKLGYFIGIIVSPIIMLVIYSTSFCTIGLILKILRKDLLSLKIDKKRKSYWDLPDNKIGSMKNQF